MFSHTGLLSLRPQCRDHLARLGPAADCRSPTVVGDVDVGHAAHRNADPILHVAKVPRLAMAACDSKERLVEGVGIPDLVCDTYLSQSSRGYKLDLRRGIPKYRVPDVLFCSHSDQGIELGLLGGQRGGAVCEAL